VFYARNPARPDRWLEWKLRCLAVGAAAMLCGMILDRRWLVGAGMAVLAAGIVLRQLGRGRHPVERDDERGGPPPPRAGGDDAP
jgi:hypothetical protein